MKNIHNKPNLLEYRKNLRRRSTAAESTLWKTLKNKQVENLKFRRQHSIDNYIVDFYCPEIRLIIELDGASHDNYLAEEKDPIRDKKLEEYDCTILRFENRYVYEFLDDIIDTIRKHKSSFLKNHV
jgi:very-short-patch-repair endonuclease